MQVILIPDAQAPRSNGACGVLELCQLRAEELAMVTTRIEVQPIPAKNPPSTAMEPDGF